MTGRCCNLKPWWTFQVWFNSFSRDLFSVGSMVLWQVSGQFASVGLLHQDGYSKQRHLDVQRKKRRNLGEISSQITGHKVNYCRAGHIGKQLSSPRVLYMRPSTMMGSCFHLAFLNTDTARLTNYAKLPPNKVKQLGYRKYLSSVQRCPCTWSRM